MYLDVAHHEQFRCEIEPHRERVHVRPVGELDLATTPVVAKQLSELNAAGFAALILDLRGVRFLDSTGLELILLWDRRARTDGFEFRIIAGPPAVQRLFDLTGTSEGLDFVEA